MEARGILAASGAKKNNTNTKNTQWTKPASGLVPPWRIFVAVRAIAPVAAIPPKRGQTIFARPWPNNSWLELCWWPVIPSATTADNNDSIAPSIAIVKAGPIKAKTSEIDISGSVRLGKPWGIPPKAVPIVATPGNW